AYLKSKLDFSDSIYVKLKNLIEEGKVYALTSSIVNKELISHVRSILENDYKNLISMDRISFNVLSKISGLKKLPQMEVFCNEAISNLEENLLCLSSEEISLKNIDAESIINDYFMKKPPFSSKKKHEFPDAIILNAILLRVEKEKCHIVSADSDWKSFCDLHKNFICYENIGSFINYCNKSGFAVTGEIQKAIKEKDCDIKNRIKNDIENTTLFVSYDFNVDCECADIIGDVNVEYLSDWNVIDIDEDNRKCNLEIECSVDFDANICGGDYDTAAYDKEDDTYFFIEEKSIDVNLERQITIKIEAFYDYNNENKLVITSYHIDKIEPFTAEYSDYDPDYPFYK
ncbi:MAG: DUF4935 domain-containing protein, partial [Alphaproteobacteria bacterium]|nr:DUF4935 domain-containing protein [Alphaproteobacteria bacterium]